ncbi:hypothetical protein GAPWKB30_2134 [Gilliamella apicola]|nr:hypothetical protein GAPWKB30_2134 [Gilliamella apicola]
MIFVYIIEATFVYFFGEDQFSSLHFFTKKSAKKLANYFINGYTFIAVGKQAY